MVLFKKTRKVMSPTRGTKHSAGIDFYMPDDFSVTALHPGLSVVIPSGIKVQLPKNTVLVAFNKSGVAVKQGLQVGACVVDEDYQGEIHIHLTNTSKMVQVLKPKTKLVQFLLLPADYSDWIEDDSIHAELTERGEGAFGSTDKK